MNMIESAEAGLAPRCAVAWNAILEVMGDGRAHGYPELEAAARRASDLERKTIENILREARTMRPPRLRATDEPGRKRRFLLR